MTPEELKAMLDSQSSELKSAQEKVEGLESALEAKEAELKKANESIDNLDKSVKTQQKSIEKLEIEIKASKNVNARDAFRAELESHKDKIKSFIDANRDSAEKKSLNISIEVKTAAAITTTGNMPTNLLGLQMDPTVHAAVPAANVFLVAFSVRPRTGNKLAWIEASSQSGADYVGELAQNTNLSDVTFSEKTRLFGKLATKMRLSTETEDWFEQLYNWCVDEGARLLESKLDEEVWKGAGVDTTQPNKIYGIKGQSTAFAALAANAVTNATIADVILDAVDQIAKGGFRANVAVLTWAGLRALKEVKTTTGEYLYDRVSGMLNGVRIFASDRLGAGEILVADSTCVETYAGNSYELEIQRDPDYDGYNVYFRKAAQVKVPTPKKKGLVYVANTTTAIAALQTA